MHRTEQNYRRLARLVWIFVPAIFLVTAVSRFIAGDESFFRRMAVPLLIFAVIFVVSFFRVPLPTVVSRLCGSLSASRSSESGCTST
jgi:uncharacterized oligopeptide transporter (OPT) family protein